MKIEIYTRDWSESVRSYHLPRTSSRICTQDGFWFVVEGGDEYGIINFDQAVQNPARVIDAIGEIGGSFIRHLAEHDVAKLAIGIQIIATHQINITFNGEKDVEATNRSIIEALESALGERVEITT